MQFEDLMRHAIDAARRGLASGQSPFGCAIARDGQLIVATHNTVVADTDITAHAEINALRAACRESDSIHLSDCIVASTCEPCPMCMAALHWSRVGQVAFGATIVDAADAGFNELDLSATELVRLGGSSVHLQSEVLGEECRQLFHDWLASPSRRVY